MSCTNWLLSVADIQAGLLQRVNRLEISNSHNSSENQYRETGKQTHAMQGSCLSWNLDMPPAQLPTSSGVRNGSLQTSFVSNKNFHKLQERIVSDQPCPAYSDGVSPLKSVTSSLTRCVLTLMPASIQSANEETVIMEREKVSDGCDWGLVRSSAQEASPTEQGHPRS